MHHMHEPVSRTSSSRAETGGRWETDGWINPVCFRQRDTANKLETDVQTRPKSIIQACISKQDEAPGDDIQTWS